MQQLWRKAVLLLVGASLMELAMSQGVQKEYPRTQLHERPIAQCVMLRAFPRGQLLARKQLASSPAGGNLQHIVGVPNVLMCGTIAQARVQLPVQGSGERTPPFWLGYATSAPQVCLLPDTCCSCFGTSTAISCLASIVQLAAYASAHLGAQFCGDEHLA